MTLKQRIKAFGQVGRFIQRHYKPAYDPAEAPLHEGLLKVIDAAHLYNNWFIPNFVNEAIKNVGIFLEESELEKFSSEIKEKEPKTVAIICAGNIPMVGFHDVMCVLLTGNIALIKLSSDDNLLLPFFLK